MTSSILLDLHTWASKGSESWLAPRLRGSWFSFFLWTGVWCGGQWCLAPWISGPYSGWPAWQHTEKIHLEQPSPSSYQLHGQMISLLERSVPETKASLKDAKAWQTQNTFSPITSWGPRLMISSFSFLFSFPLHSAISVFCTSSLDSITRKRESRGFWQFCSLTYQSTMDWITRWIKWIYLI